MVGVELTDPVDVSLVVPLSEDVTVFVAVDVLLEVEVNVPVEEIRGVCVKGVLVAVKVGFRVGDVVAVPVPVLVNPRLVLTVGLEVVVLDWIALRVKEEDPVDVFVPGIVLVDVRVTSCVDVPFADRVIVELPVPVLDAAADCVKLGDALVVFEDCLDQDRVGEEEDVFDTRLDADAVLEAVLVLLMVVDPVEVCVP